jgi:Tfp pilus assembly protein PilN
MKRGHDTLAVLVGACLVLAACSSGPSSSAPDREAGESEAALLTRKADFIGGILARRSLASRVLDDLTSALPDRARLIEVTLVASTAQVRGAAPTHNVLADYLSRLAAAPP